MSSFMVGSIKSAMTLGLDGWNSSVSAVVRDTGKLKKELSSVGTQAAAVGRDLGLAGAAITTTFGAMVKIAAQTEEAENLFTVSMGNMADSTREWSDELSDSLGMSAFTIRDVTGNLNVVVKNMGLTEQAAASMSKEMTKLTFDMSSFYNLPHQAALDKLKAGILGESEPLKQLGIVLSEARAEAFAFSNGIADTGTKLSEAQKVVARYGLIMAQTRDAQGDLTRTGGSLTNQTRRLTDQLKEMAITTGNVLVPAVTSIVQPLNDVVRGFKTWGESHANLYSQMVKIAAGTGVVLAGIGSLTLALGIATKAFNVLRNTAAVAWAVVSGPIGGIIAAVAALGTGIYVARAVWKENWEIMRRTSQDVTDAVNNMFGGMFDRAKEVAAGIVGFFRNAWNFIAENFSHVMQIGLGIDTSSWTKELRDGGEIVSKGVADIIETTKKQLKEDFGSLPEELQSLLKNISGAFTAPDFEGYSDMDFTALLEGAQGAEALTAAANKAKDAIATLRDEAVDLRISLYPQEAFAVDLQRIQEIATAFPDIIDDAALTLSFEALFETFSSSGMSAAELVGNSMEDVPRRFQEAMELAIERTTMAARETAMEMAAIADNSAQLDSASRGLEISADLTGLGALQDMIGAMEDLKAAGRLDGESMNLLVKRYWSDFSQVPKSAVGEIVNSLNDIPQEAAGAFKKAALEGGNFRKSLEFDKVAGDVSAITSAIGRIGPQFADVAKAGQVATSALSIGAKALTGDWIGIALEIINVIGLFGDAGKEAQKELTGMAKLIEELKEASKQWVDSLAQKFTEFIRTGKADFRSFIDDILDQILQLAITHLVLNPLLGLGAGLLPFADGGAFDKGHIVDSPEFFGTKSGPAVRGEAGTEVVMPAVKLRDGTLGVKGAGGGGGNMVVNVIDNRSSNQPAVKVRERTGPDGEMIRELIINEVRSGFIRGDYDSELQLIGPRLR